MRYIKSYNQHINENYNQAKALGEKNNIDITHILKLLIQADTDNIKDYTKYRMPYNIEKERKNRVYIGLFTRIYCEYAKTNHEDFMLSLAYGHVPDAIIPIYDYIMSNKAPLNIINNKTHEITVLSNILDIYKVVEKNDDGRSVLETLTDAISTQKIDNNVKEWINKMPSTLKHLFNNDISEKDNLKSLIITYMGMKDDVKNDISNTFFGKTGKISAYKTTQKFLQDFNDIIKSKEENFGNLVILAESRKDIDIRYINKDREIMVVSVHTFNASQLFGEKVSWCISRESSYFKQYYKQGERQLIFVINMKETDIDMSKIGICMKPSGVIYAAHDKKDASLEDEIVYNYLAQNKIPQSSIAYKETALSKMIKSIYNSDDFVKYFNESTYNYDMCVRVLEICSMNEIYNKINHDIEYFLCTNKELFGEFIGKEPLHLQSTRYIIDNHTEFFLNNYETLWNTELDMMLEPSIIDDMLYDETYDRFLNFVKYLKSKNSRNIKNMVKDGSILIFFTVTDKPDILDIFDFNVMLVINTINISDNVAYLYDEKDITLGYIQEYCGIPEIGYIVDIDEKYLKDAVLNIRLIDINDPDFIKKYETCIEKFGETYFIDNISKALNRMYPELEKLVEENFKYKYLILKVIDIDTNTFMIDHTILFRFLLENSKPSERVCKRIIDNKKYDVSDLIPVDILKEFMFKMDYDTIKYIGHEANNVNKSIFTDITCINILFNLLTLSSEIKQFILRNVDFATIKPEFIYYKTPILNNAEQHFTYMSGELFLFLYDNNKLPVNQTLNAPRKSVLDEIRVDMGVNKFGLKIIM